MGGKGGSSGPQELQRNLPSTDMQLEGILGMFSGMMEGMMGMTESMMQSMSEMNQDMSTPDYPSIFEGPEIDWTSQASALVEKAKGDVSLEDKQKRNRTSTIRTSPLLEDKDVTTTNSILSS